MTVGFKWMSVEVIGGVEDGVPDIFDVLRALQQCLDAIKVSSKPRQNVSKS